jgi:hypothetical protein
VLPLATISCFQYVEAGCLNVEEVEWLQYGYDQRISWIFMPSQNLLLRAMNVCVVCVQDVGQRILGAIVFRRSLFSEIEAKPDLYGPFWLSTTAIFLMAMISNALDFFAYKDSQRAWEGDLEKIASGVLLCLVSTLAILGIYACLQGW